MDQRVKMNIEGCIIIKKHPTLDIYCCSDGRILKKTSKNRQAEFFRGTLRTNGYFCIIINKKQKLVHRLIAETFICNPEHKPTVDHINRNPQDNRVENLRWATMHEQGLNSRNSDKRIDYGVRKCDDLKAYRAAYHKVYQKKNAERLKKYQHDWYQRRKQKMQKEAA